MPAPKKAAKKTASKHGPEHDIKDERRAFEHQGRVEALHKLIEKGEAKHITKLTEMARQELEAGHKNHAADLLRAAEHLSFAYVLGSAPAEAHPKLREEITHEFQAKLQKAEEHWKEKGERLDGLEEIFHSTKQHAQKALEAGSLRTALELARGAEALAHVKEKGEATDQAEDAGAGNEDQQDR